MARMRSIKTEDPHFSYEEGLKQLEAIVVALEQGQLPLEDAFREFEKGIKLTKKCQGILEQLSQKVFLLTSDSEGTLSETPFVIPTEE